MNTYENIVIFDSSLSEEEFRSAKEKVASLITESEGGKILKVDDWGMKKLAYEINKHKKGYYVLFLFTAPPSLISRMEGYYKVFDPVIKYMFVKLGKKQIAAVEAEMSKAAEAQSVEPAPVKENV